MSVIHGMAAAGLRLIDPEAAHAVTLAALRAGLGPRRDTRGDPVLATTLGGLDLPNPLGLAAGFDKNAQVFAPMLRAGFGFVECGTTTPLAQRGNPRPRLFRLGEDKAVINRLGFNNEGVEAFRARLGNRGRGVVGANVGPNRDSPDRVGDYLSAVGALWGLCDYFTINVSSPNTPGLRALQSGGGLEELLCALQGVREGRPGPGVPFFLKIAPDLAPGEIERIVAAAMKHRFDGLVVANTTSARPGGLRSGHRGQAGGLSGEPLAAAATLALRIAWEAAAGRLAMIGVGGIASGAGAYARIRAGAGAVQLYSALVYRGPGLVGAILGDLAQRLRADGFSRVAQAVGAR